MERWKDRIKRGIFLYSENKLTVYSGNATLFIVISFFPLLMLIIAIVNMLPGYSAKDAAGILLQILPDLDPVRDLAESAIKNLNKQSGGLLASVTALTTLWSASKGVGAIQLGLNHLFHDEHKGGIKNILKRLLFTVLLVILIPALLMIEMLGKSITDSICRALHISSSHIDSIVNITSIAVSVMALLVIILIFAFLPATRRTRKSQIPGALVTGVCWFVFTELFAFFIPKIYHASALYGSLASLFLIVLWLRFIVMILFGGAVLNRLLDDEKTWPYAKKKPGH